MSSRKKLLALGLSVMLAFPFANAGNAKAAESNNVANDTEIQKFEGVVLEAVTVEDMEAAEKQAAEQQSDNRRSMKSAAAYSTAAAPRFVDIQGHWAQGNIEHLASKHIIDGYDKNGQKYFAPKKEVTRAQAAKMIINAIGEKESAPKTARFKDVPADNWAAGYIERAYELGIFGGYGDGKFGPNNTLKRSQMAAALSKALKLGYNGYTAAADTPVFKDVKSSHWAFSQIQKVHFNGISNGSNFHFYPERLILRDEFSAFLSRGIDTDYRLPITGGNANPGKPDAGEPDNGSGDGTSDPNAPIPDGPTAATAKVIAADVLNIRQGPSTSTAIVGKMAGGTVVAVNDISGNWARVNHNGVEGYVNKAYLKLYSNDPSKPLKDRIIVVDAGHGGSDSGAGKFGEYEKNITLKVAKLLKANLEAKGAKVHMTRENDSYPSLKDRVNFTKKVNGELFISVHVNSANGSAKGTEVFFDNRFNMNGVESKLMATEIQKEIVKNVGTYDRGAKLNPGPSGFYVIRNQNVPAVLVELAFIDNAGDHKLLVSPQYQKIFANSIANGIVKYMRY